MSCPFPLQPAHANTSYNCITYSIILLDVCQTVICTYAKSKVEKKYKECTLFDIQKDDIFQRCGSFSNGEQLKQDLHLVVK